MSDSMSEIRRWLDRFSECVQRRDYEGGRTLFHDDVYCFGSYANRMSGLDELVRNQWREIWPRISDFRFDMAQARIEMGTAGDLACVMTPWSSTDDRTGVPRHQRSGRATILLRRDPGEGDWRACHTHYSLNPERKP